MLHCQDLETILKLKLYHVISYCSHIISNVDEYYVSINLTGMSQYCIEKVHVILGLGRMGCET